MQKNPIIIISIAFSIIAIVFGVVTYSRLGEQREQNASLLDENADLQNKIQTKDKQIAEYERLLADAEQKNAAYRNNYGADNFNQAYQQQAPKAPQDFGAQEAPAQNQQPAMDPTRERMMNQQASMLYGDLVKELGLPEESSKKLMNHFTQSMKSEAELGAKIIDPNVSVEEILRLQETLAKSTDGELNSFLNPREQEVAKNYRNNLPKNTQKKHLMNLVDQLGLSEQEKQKTSAAIERALEQTESPKGPGRYSKEDIIQLREKLGGKKPGSPEFMRVTLEMGEAETQKIIKNLQDLPKDQYERLKEQLEMPFKMMRQNMPPPGR